MTELEKAQKELSFWRKKYQEKRKKYRNSWSYDVDFAAHQCKIWRQEIDKLQGTT